MKLDIRLGRRRGIAGVYAPLAARKSGTRVGGNFGKVMTGYLQNARRLDQLQEVIQLGDFAAVKPEPIRLFRRGSGRRMLSDEAATSHACREDARCLQNAQGFPQYRPRHPQLFRELRSEERRVGK